MMTDLITDDILYEALLARDDSYEGQYFVGVKSTGIFCRLTCPARKPKRENCSFYDSVGAALSAGFRPCKRCHPMQEGLVMNEAVADLVSRLQADPCKRWRESDITALGYDLSTIRRQFKRTFGITFLDMARQLRLRLGFETLSNGDPVIDAQLEAGFSSGSGFRDAFSNLLGIAPGYLNPDALLKADWVDTPLGPMIMVADTTHLHLLEFTDRKGLPAELKKLHKAVPLGLGLGRTQIHEKVSDQLREFFEGKRSDFDVPLKLWGSDFTQNVWRSLQGIPPGQTRSYADMAKAIGRPSAVRAVARANGANQIAIIIPCHRVIGSDGSLTGYAGGLWRKEKLIKLETGYSR